MWQEILVINIIFLASLGNLGLAIYVYKKGPGQRINRAFCFFGLTLFLWCFVNFLSLLTKSPFFLRATYATGSFVPLGGILFGYALADKKFNKLIKIVITLLACFFFYLSFTSLMVKEVFRFETTGFVGVFGKAFIFWVIFMSVLVLLSLYVPIRSFFKAKGKRRAQIGYFMLGGSTFAVWTTMVSIVLPALGFLKLSNIDSPSTLFLTSFTAYAIVKYQLMGIRALLFRAFLFSLTIALLSSFLVLLIFLGSWFFTYLGMSGIWLVALFVAVFAILIGRSFYQKTKALEEAKTTLEVRVKARTKELEELTANLEQKVKERTKELQERVEELETIHKLTVGRELKMIELKKEIEELKKEIKNSKKTNST